jgi:ATP synthase F1 delta subunit
MKITAKQYAQTLYDLTEGKTKPEIEKTVSDFARYLHRSRKLKLSEKIIENYSKLYDREKMIVEAEVVTREKIGEALEKKAKHFVKEKYKAKEVVLKNIIDPNIKGGMVLKVGDEVMDGSLRGKLGELKKILVG